MVTVVYGVSISTPRLGATNTVTIGFETVGPAKEFSYAGFAASLACPIA